MKSKSAYKLMSLVFVLLLIFISFIAVIVNNLMTGTTASDTAINMGVGQTYQFPESTAKIRFHSYNKEIVTVDKNGVITAVSKGSAQIAAGRKRIDVNVYDAPESVELDDGAFSMGVGEEYTLSPYVPGSEFNTGFTYTLSGDNAVTVDENGKITDDTRIRGALPTLKKILEDGGSLIITTAPLPVMFRLETRLIKSAFRHPQTHFFLVLRAKFL